MANTEQMTIEGITFDADTQMKYSKPKVNASGGKSINILNTSTNKSLYLTTPLMLTWGVNEYTDEKSGKVTYDMALQFPSEEYATEQASAFLENVKKMEEKVKDDAIVNCRDWMGKPKMTAEVVDALFTPMLKYPKDKNTSEPDYTKSPTLKVKLNYWEGEFKCELYDMDQNALFPNNDGVAPRELVQKGTNVACVLQCGGVWFANGKFGVTWRLLQAVVQPRASMTGRCLITISAEDKERAKAAVASTTDDVGDEEVGVEVEDSDDDDDNDVDVKAEVAEAVEEATPPAPEPVVDAPKKKVVRRKKAAE